MENKLKEQFEEFCKEKKSKEPIIIKVGLKPRPLADKLRAIYTMILCAQFLNKGESKEKYSFYLEEGDVVLRNTNELQSIVSFESKEKGEQAYDILGETKIKNALL